MNEVYWQRLKSLAAACKPIVDAAYPLGGTSLTFHAPPRPDYYAPQRYILRLVLPTEEPDPGPTKSPYRIFGQMWKGEIPKDEQERIKQWCLDCIAVAKGEKDKDAIDTV